MPGDPLRLFFAVFLDEALRKPVAEAQSRLGKSGERIKWVEPQNLHFTLRFLGDTPAQTVGRLSEVSSQVAGRHGALDLHIAGVGAFPRAPEARAVWVDCREGGDELSALATDLESALVSAGLAGREPRPFRAHLTVGRSKTGQPTPSLAREIEACAELAIGDMRVSEFCLVSSNLRPQGPEYKVVQRFELA